MRTQVKLWFWTLKDIIILGVALTVSVVSWAKLNFVVPAALTALYGFLTQTWYNVGIALGCEVLCGAILFVGAFLMAEADVLKDYLLHL